MTDRNRRLLKAWSTALSVAVLLATAGCGDKKKPDPDPEPSRADSIAVSPDSVSFLALADTARLNATVLDQYGDPMSGLSFLWASDNPAVATVDGSGVVTSEGDGSTLVRVQAGTVRASVFVEVAQEPSDIQSIAGNLQHNWTGFPLEDSLAVRVTDAAGTPVESIPISWQVEEGGGTMFPISPVTDEEGEASAYWLLRDGASGVQTAYAVMAETDTVWFSATGTAAIEAMNQGGLTGDMLDTVKVTLTTLDSLGAPQAGIPLEFTDLTGFGEVVQGPTATDINGDLELKWALGPTPGPQTITVGRGDIPWSFELSASATGTLDPWPFTSVSTGFYHTCGIDNTNTAFCWGFNEQSQLGTADTVPVLTPKAVPTLLSWRALGGGETHTCGLTSPGGIVHCWGTGLQAGQGTDDPVPDPTAVPGGPWTALSVGAYHTCTLMADGTAWCWGQDEEGRLGAGAATPAGAPTAVTGGLAFTEISSGHFHTCGLVDPGTAYCWGDGEFGQLGNGTVDDQTSPVMVTGGITWAQVDAGRFHTCGISTAGEAFCWGEGGFNQLGDGLSNEDQTSPVKVLGDHQWTDLAAGQFHTCGIASTGKLYCWGRGGYIGLENFGSAIPAVVLPAYNWRSVETQGIHTCAITTSNETYCWGPNDAGQLGIGSTDTFLVPRIVYRGVL